MATTDLHPTAGARFLYERDEVTDDDRSVRYRASIYTATERFDYQVAMEIDGSFAVASQSPGAPEELVTKLGTIAKLVARAAQKRKDDGLVPWPERLLRWRGPGR